MTFRLRDARCVVFALLLASLAGKSAMAVVARQLPDDLAITARDEDTASTQCPSGMQELYRLRIVNRRGGTIQVSTDTGETWRTIGHVLTPATTAAEGYTAAQYIEPGTVAATAVHGLRIRVGAEDRTLHDPLILSIDPVEYGDDVAQDPGRGYGGQVTGSAGILTDIPAGTSIFRELAPLVGDPVCLETAGGGLRRLPSGFRPEGNGEALVILGFAPVNSLTEVTFVNKPGGDVTVKYVDGTTAVATQVIKPVLGVGRFDGTSFTGVGNINTDHTGVITVSTSPVDRGGGTPEGYGRERRGGFQISPAWHNARLEEAGASMVMSLGTYGKPFHRQLEATAPLFRWAIGLGDAPDEAAAATGTAPDPSAMGEALVDIRIDNGPWEPMPALIGSIPDAFTAAGMNRFWKKNGVVRVCSEGVMGFRLRLPSRGPERSRRAASAAVTGYRTRRYALARSGSMPIVSGLLTVNANPTNPQGVAFVRLKVEGDTRGFSNIAPFALHWDTRTVPDGDYLIEAEAMDQFGRVLANTPRRVFVMNDPRTAASSPGTGADAHAAAITRPNPAGGG